jgi:tetratricopeptide (TPR) repeat protein
LEELAEYDKAIEIREQLVYVKHQTHLANDLARAHVGKGVALDGLTKSTEAVAEYDKAIAILERLVYVEQQAHLADDLAMAYMNKGNALRLTKLPEAIAEYDKAIMILERLVNVEQQAHLADNLALVYTNKALVLQHQQDWDDALSFYEKSVQIRTLCVEQGKMFWLMPELLKTLRYRLETLLDLRRWPVAAQDVLRFRSLYQPYLDTKGIDDRLKEAAGKEFAKTITRLGALTNEQRELLYAELGDEAAAIRSLVLG